MTKPSPCYKCEKRTLTCHDTCEEYAEFDRENKRRLAAKHREEDALADILLSPSRQRQDRKKLRKR